MESLKELIDKIEFSENTEKQNKWFKDTVRENRKNNFLTDILKDEYGKFRVIVFSAVTLGIGPLIAGVASVKDIINCRRDVKNVLENQVKHDSKLTNDIDEALKLKSKIYQLEHMSFDDLSMLCSRINELSCSISDILNPIKDEINLKVIEINSLKEGKAAVNDNNKPFLNIFEKEYSETKTKLGFAEVRFVSIAEGLEKWDLLKDDRILPEGLKVDIIKGLKQIYETSNNIDIYRQVLTRIERAGRLLLADDGK